GVSAPTTARSAIIVADDSFYTRLLRADNFEEVIVSAVSMIFGFGMGPPDFAFKPESHAQKKSTDIVHLFRPNTPNLLPNHFKKRGSASPSAHEFAMTTASRSLATALP